MEYHLAQLNIARFLAPPDSPRQHAFVDALVPVNALADDADGFVWRLQTDDGDATASARSTTTADAREHVGLGVAGEAAAFVYTNPAHVSIMRRRREFAETMVEAHLVLWWVPAGHIPTVDEAKERLELLRADGPTPQAFTFRAHFRAPGEGTGAEAVQDDRWLCPA